MSLYEGLVCHSVPPTLIAQDGKFHLSDPIARADCSLAFDELNLRDTQLL